VTTTIAIVTTTTGSATNSDLRHDPMTTDLQAQESSGTTQMALDATKASPTTTSMLRRRPTSRKATLNRHRCRLAHHRHLPSSSTDRCQRSLSRRCRRSSLARSLEVYHHLPRLTSVDRSRLLCPTWQRCLKTPTTSVAISPATTPTEITEDTGKTQVRASIKATSEAPPRVTFRATSEVILRAIPRATFKTTPRVDEEDTEEITRVADTTTEVDMAASSVVSVVGGGNLRRRR
jgi:hypothetical protein